MINIQNLKYKSIDVMKLTKDNVNNPLPDLDIQKVVNNLKALGITHIAISVPMDYPAYALKWTTAIHGANLKVLHRGTWNAIEGIYGITKAVGTNRPPDTINYWINKTKDYILNNPNLFADGDLWGPLPERTENIFQDSTSFLPGPLPDNYVVFFNGLVDASKQAFTTINKAVEVGHTTNNFTEIKSGWIPQSLFDKAGRTVVDHYGSNHTTSEMDTDLRGIFTQRGKPVFLQEWGNYWNNGSIDDARSMFDVFKKLATENILIGFNYWGGWPGAAESILNADYTVNDKGKLLGSYFVSTTPTPDPVPEPTPEVEKFVQVYGASTIIALTSKGNLWKYYNGKWSKISLPTF